MAWIEGWNTTVARGDDGEQRERGRGKPYWRHAVIKARNDGRQGMNGAEEELRKKKR